jgi:hypothetical protein
LDAHLTAKVAAVTCLQLIVNWLLGVDRLWLLAFNLAVNDGCGLGYSNVDLGGKGGFKLLAFDVPLCPLKIRARIKLPDQPFFDLSRPSTWNTNWTMLLDLSLGLRPIISEAAAMQIQRMGLASRASMVREQLFPSAYRRSSSFISRTSWSITLSSISPTFCWIAC